MPRTAVRPPEPPDRSDTSTMALPPFIRVRDLFFAGWDGRGKLGAGGRIWPGLAACQRRSAVRVAAPAPAARQPGGLPGAFGGTKVPWDALSRGRLPA